MSVLENNTTELQELLAMANNLPDANDVPNTAVLYTEQTLTDEQKQQARTNIGITGTGADGKDGKDGTNGTDGVGIKSVVQTTTSSEDGGSNVITVTKTDGTTSTFIVMNGSKGKDGTNGTNGTNGKDGADGKTPVKGTDYFTSADKTEMVNAVIAALPKYNGGVS